MQNADESVTCDLSRVHELVKNGKYYEIARSWYCTRYLEVYTQRSGLVFVTIAFVLGAFMMYNNAQMLFPIVRGARYLIYTNNTQGDISYTSEVFRATAYGENIYQSMASMLATNYVKIRETYDYSKIRQQADFVKTQSSAMVFATYKESVSSNNPNSTVIKYQQYATRVVDILSSSFDSKNAMTIKYNAKVFDTAHKVAEDAVFEASISFEMHELNSDLKPGSKFPFLVTSYATKIVSGDVQKKK